MFNKGRYKFQTSVKKARWSGNCSRSSKPNTWTVKIWPNVEFFFKTKFFWMTDIITKPLCNCKRFIKVALGVWKWDSVTYHIRRRSWRSSLFVMTLSFWRNYSFIQGSGVVGSFPDDADRYKKLHDCELVRNLLMFRLSKNWEASELDQHF